MATFSHDKYVYHLIIKETTKHIVIKNNYRNLFLGSIRLAERMEEIDISLQIYST